MSHRYDDDPMTYVPYTPDTVLISRSCFRVMCALSCLGILFVVLVLLIA